MATTPTKRTRSERVASLQTGPNRLHHFWNSIRQIPAVLRLVMTAISILLIVVALRGWQPPFAFRQGFVPSRAIVARVAFSMPDPTKTAVLKAQQGREVICFYENRRQPMTQLRGALKDQLFKLIGTNAVEELTADQRASLDEFLVRVGTSDEPPWTPDQALRALQSTLGEELQREKFDLVLKGIFDPIEEKGLFKSLRHDIDSGNQRWIRVFPTGQETDIVTVEVERVRIAEVVVQLRSKLRTEFRREFNRPEAETVADLIHNFLSTRLPETLTYRRDLSDKARLEAIDSVPTAMIPFQPGVTTLVPAGKPLSAEELSILKAEHAAWLRSDLTFSSRAIRLGAFVGMFAALYLLVGTFIYHQFERSLLENNLKLLRLLSLFVGCLALSGFMASDPWRAEIVPVVLTAITATIVYGRSLALLLLTSISVSLSIALGFSLGEFVSIAATAATAIMTLGRLRTRTRLMWVGAIVAIVTVSTGLGVGILIGQVQDVARETDSTIAVPSSFYSTKLFQNLLSIAGLQGLHALMACLLMTGLLPIVERIFDVQTDMRLLELGDASHPLLRQLAQRAPGTYNHSINVAAIAEAAADSIGAHGLLTRVGAYFHDIGKMFKPNYFVENQSPGSNRHENLQPAMSTLVIIAHVKDGADLARQHHLPKPIIDFIEQHHGTTLVEYFFRQATKKSEASPHGEEVSEMNFRYPGPKPQSREAAVLMLADAVESASRSLVEPTPARIQSLVDQLAMKRLLDNQFSECGLNLNQLELVKRSLVKSLTAIYHGRVKYPGQQTA